MIPSPLMDPAGDHDDSGALRTFFFFQLCACSIFGKSVFTKKHTFKFKTDVQVANAIRFDYEWLKKLVSLEPVSVTVNEKGHLTSLFLAKMSTRPTFSAIQLGASVLSNSKATLAIGYHNLTRLYNRKRWRLNYVDTGRVCAEIRSLPFFVRTRFISSLFRLVLAEYQ